MKTQWFSVSREYTWIKVIVNIILQFSPLIPFISFRLVLLTSIWKLALLVYVCGVSELSRRLCDNFNSFSWPANSDCSILWPGWGVVWQSEWGVWHQGSCPIPKHSLNSQSSMGMCVSLMDSWCWAQLCRSCRQILKGVSSFQSQLILFYYSVGRKRSCTAVTIKKRLCGIPAIYLAV